MEIIPQELLAIPLHSSDSLQLRFFQKYEQLPKNIPWLDRSFSWVNPDFSKGLGFEIDTDVSLSPCE